MRLIIGTIPASLPTIELPILERVFSLLQVFLFKEKEFWFMFMGGVKLGLFCLYLVLFKNLNDALETFLYLQYMILINHKIDSFQRKRILTKI